MFTEAAPSAPRFWIELQKAYFRVLQLGFQWSNVTCFHFVIYGHVWCYERYIIAHASGNYDLKTFLNITSDHNSRNTRAVQATFICRVLIKVSFPRLLCFDNFAPKLWPKNQACFFRWGSTCLIYLWERKLLENEIRKFVLHSISFYSQTLTDRGILFKV